MQLTNLLITVTQEIISIIEAITAKANGEQLTTIPKLSRSLDKTFFIKSPYMYTFHVEILMNLFLSTVAVISSMF